VPGLQFEKPSGNRWPVLGDGGIKPLRDAAVWRTETVPMKGKY
jgi:hypothetical protein